MNGGTVQGTAVFGVGPEWSLAGVGDLNLDGREDIVWRSPSTGTVVVWFMNGSTLLSTSVFGVGLEWDLVGVGDIDGSGTADLLWRNACGGTSVVWFMNGGSLQGTAVFPSVGTEWTRVCAGGREWVTAEGRYHLAQPSRQGRSWSGS